MSFVASVNGTSVPHDHRLGRLAGFADDAVADLILLDHSRYRIAEAGVVTRGVKRDKS